MMNNNIQRWQKLFLFTLGFALASGFCMKWLESEMIQGGEKFTIVGLELFYSKEKLQSILAGLDLHSKAILEYHLVFDFAFMTGVFPMIASICMIAREKTRSRGLRKFFFLLAVLQLFAWAGDITENCWMLRWVNGATVGTDFSVFHWIVSTKWIIALTGFFSSVFFAIRKARAHD